MKILNLFLNYACNARCGFCFNPADPSETQWKGMSTRKALAVMLDAYKAGCRSVSFIGGEATVRPDFVKIAAAARRIGFEDLRLVTNGFKLADKDYADSLIAAGIGGVDLSLHSHLEGINDRLLGVKGATAKALAALENLQAHPVRIGLNIVVNKLNYAHLPETAEFYARRGVKNFSFFSLRYIGHLGLAENMQALKVAQTETAPFVRRALGVLEAHGCLDRVCLGDFTPCVLPGYEDLMTDWAGGCNPDRVCDPEGRSEDSEAVCSDGKRLVAACGSCVFRDRCLGVNEPYLTLFGDSEFKPVLKEEKIVRRAQRILS